MTIKVHCFWSAICEKSSSLRCTQLKWRWPTAVSKSVKQSQIMAFVSVTQSIVDAILWPFAIHFTWSTFSPIQLSVFGWKLTAHCCFLFSLELTVHFSVFAEMSLRVFCWFDCRLNKKEEEKQSLPYFDNCLFTHWAN